MAKRLLETGRDVLGRHDSGTTVRPSETSSDGIASIASIAVVERGAT